MGEPKRGDFRSVALLGWLPLRGPRPLQGLGPRIDVLVPRDVGDVGQVPDQEEVPEVAGSDAGKDGSKELLGEAEPEVGKEAADDAAVEDLLHGVVGEVDTAVDDHQGDGGVQEQPCRLPDVLPPLALVR